MSKENIYVPKSDNTNFYTYLYLRPQESNLEIINKNYKKLIKIFHSDKGGSVEYFQLIKKASEILTNPGLKYIYDNYGVIAFDIINIQENHLFLTYFKWITNFILHYQKEIKNLQKKIQKLNENENFNFPEKSKIYDPLEDVNYLKNLIKIYLNKINLHENTLEAIKEFIDSKISRRFKENFLDSTNQLENFDLTYEIFTNRFDYLLAKIRNPHISINSKDLGNYFEDVSVKFSNSINFLKRTNHSLSLYSEFKIDRNTKIFYQTYELNFDKMFVFSNRINIFGNNFLSTNNSIALQTIDNEILFNNGVTIPNIFFNENLSLKFDSKLCFNRLSGEFKYDFNKFGLTYRIHNNLSSSVNFDLVTNVMETHIVKKIDKNNKITFYGSIGKSRNIFGIQRIFYSSKNTNDNTEILQSADYTGKYSIQNSIYLHEGGIIISNQNSINFKVFGLDLDPSINIFKKGKVKFNTSLSIGVRINKLNFKIPIQLSKANNYIVFVLAFLSNSFGSFLNFIYKRYRNYIKNTGNYLKIVYDLINEKYSTFQNNEENIKKYNKIVRKEKEVHGLIINFAYIGILEEINLLNEKINITGKSNKEFIESNLIKDRRVYDIRMALTFRIAESKLAIYDNLLDIEGTYTPAITKKDRIGMIISYTYKLNSYYDLIKNIETEIKIPLVE